MCGKYDTALRGSEKNAAKITRRNRILNTVYTKRKKERKKERKKKERKKEGTENKRN